MAAAILSASVTAVMGPIWASYRQTQVMQQSTAAASLARQLLDEIIAKPLADPTTGDISHGPDATQLTRGQYKLVGDYNGYSDTTSVLTELDGSAVTWNSGGIYTRTVKIAYRATPAGSEAASGDFALVTVSVKAPGGDVVTAQRLVSNFPRLLLKPMP